MTDDQEAPVWFKHRAWIPVAWIASVLNVGAVWFAAMPGEPAHATVHALLALLFGVGAQRLAQRHQVIANEHVVEDVRELESRLADLTSLPSNEGRLPELEERIDFLERALVELRNRAQVPLKNRTPT